MSQSARIVGILAAGLALSQASVAVTTFRPLVMGKRAVVAAGHPLVAEAGLRILHKGGNAIDAGVASVFAAAVVEMEGFGVGGVPVSCLSKDVAGAPTAVNVMTSAFPATTGPATAGGGNARIEAYLQLPKPCIAPIVFVTSPTGAWFASTGL